MYTSPRHVEHLFVIDFNIHGNYKAKFYLPLQKNRTGSTTLFIETHEHKIHAIKCLLHDSYVQVPMRTKLHMKKNVFRKY